jgi:hypothetical protein
MEILQILLEDTEKNTLSEGKIIILSLVLTIDSERWEHFTECSAMLATPVRNVWMEDLIWEGAKIQPTISTRPPEACTDTSHAFVHHILQEQ